MKKLISFAAVIIASMQMGLCQMGALKGSGKVVNKTFGFTNFSKIDLLDLDGKVTITVGKPFSIAVNIDDNLANLLDVAEADKTLTVSLNGNKNNRLYVEDSKIDINISVPSLTDVFQRSNGNLTINNIANDAFSLKNNGNGNIYLNGTVTILNITARGNGNVYANKILAKNINITRSGNGDVYTNAENVNTIESSGNGKIVNEKSAAVLLKFANIYAANTIIEQTVFATTNTITIYLKNNSIFPKKPTVISYEPGQVGNSTNGFILMPGQKKKLQFPIDTKIYLATNKQVDVVMSGKRIDAEKPFLIVKQEDDNGVFGF